MKTLIKNTLFAIVILLVSTPSSLFAQWGTNSATGTTINGTSNKYNVIGTSSLSLPTLKDLIFVTNGTQKMVLTANGSLGTSNL